MSAIEFIACIAAGAYIVLLGILALFDRFIMTNNSTAGRKPTEEMAEAIRKYKAQIDADIAAYTGIPKRMSAHDTLGVSATATQEEIKTAYRRMAMKHHPDRGGSQDKFQEIKVAYEQLMKPSRCLECDGKGTIRVKRGAFVDTVQCPRCWPSKEGEK